MAQVADRPVDLTTRGGFVRALEGSSVDLDRARESVRLRSAPLARADLNGDGVIRGRKEASRLFSIADRLDRDGDPDRIEPREPRWWHRLARRRSHSEAYDIVRAAWNVADADRAPGPVDPYAARVTMPEGPFEGEPIRLDKKRSATVLGPAEAARWGGQPNELVVANVYHQGEFYVARIPMDSIASVRFQSESFPAIVPVAHSQLRFDFDQPVHLVPQVEGSGAAPVSLTSLVFSVEATGTRSYAYDLSDGFRDHFVNAFRLLSGQTRFQETVVGRGGCVRQWSLELSAGQRRHLLSSLLERATEQGLGQTYNTLNHNCTTNLLDLIDQAIGASFWQRTASAVIGRMPAAAGAYLCWRGLAAQEGPTWNEERPL